MKKKADYDLIAKYYDNVIGGGYESSDYLIKNLKKYHNTAKSILELGCGTGENIRKLIKGYELTGIDISSEMLKIAKAKFPGADFKTMDIRKFSIKKKFDLIVCLYDTINHIILFSDWKKIFKNTAEHLSDNGLFIFDINTVYKLEYFTSISPIVHKFGNNYLIITLSKLLSDTYNWNIKVFERKNKNIFELTEVDIKESSFAKYKIIKELVKNFTVMITEDDSGKKVKANSGRIFFVCRKK